MIKIVYDIWDQAALTLFLTIGSWEPVWVGQERSIDGRRTWTFLASLLDPLFSRWFFEAMGLPFDFIHDSSECYYQKNSQNMAGAYGVVVGFLVSGGVCAVGPCGTGASGCEVCWASLACCNPVMRVSAIPRWVCCSNKALWISFKAILISYCPFNNKLTLSLNQSSILLVTGRFLGGMVKGICVAFRLRITMWVDVDCMAVSGFAWLPFSDFSSSEVYIVVLFY